MMPDTELEHVEFEVPINTGPLIGNTLRQFAMRGTNTWQVAAYKLGGKEGTFGLSGGHNFSYLRLLDGKLISTNVDAAITEKLCKFEFQDGLYRCGDMSITNLEKLSVPSFEACLVYASGSRTAEQNYAVVKRLVPQDLNSYFTVPSKHTLAIKFRYNVKPFDRQKETLVIEATPGVVMLARDSAVKSLSGLHI